MDGNSSFYRAQIKTLGALPSPADNKHLSPVQKDVLSSLHQAYEMGDDFRRTVS